MSYLCTHKHSQKINLRTSTDSDIYTSRMDGYGDEDHLKWNDQRQSVTTREKMSHKSIEQWFIGIMANILMEAADEIEYWTYLSINSVSLDANKRK